MRPYHRSPRHRPWTVSHIEERRKRHFLMWRLARPFFMMTSVFLVLVCLAAAVFNHFYETGGGPLPRLLWIAVCGLSLAFPVMVIAFAGLAFRSLAPPLSHVMAAADAVADGDFSVRIPENSPGEFGRLARSFNRMTSELERAEQQRQNLTADVAHELRTPLHIIQGNLEGVLDGVYQPTNEHIQATLEETHLLARLVNDLQTLSLAEAGQLPLHPQHVLVADLLSDVYLGCRVKADEAGIKFQLVDPLPDVQIFADADRLNQVLTNLATNAIQHTPQGGVIRLSAEADDDGVNLSISDTGAGISPEDLPYVFDRFWRGDRSRTRLQGGSGLGLAIARQLVQAHGGEIQVKSEVGQGTVFTIHLPLS